MSNKSYKLVPVIDPDDIVDLEDRFHSAYESNMDDFINGEYPEIDLSKMSYQDKIEFINDAEDPIKIARFGGALGMAVALREYEIEVLRNKLAILNN